jgi:hypothetical protein
LDLLIEAGANPIRRSRILEATTLSTSRERAAC